LEVVVRRGILLTLVASISLAFITASPSMELTANEGQGQNSATNVAAVGFQGGSYNVSTPGSSGGGSGGNDYVCSQAGLPGGVSATLSGGELTLS
jgi:hypothetical protein